ncbi:MAG: Rieske 2Fe-2S domain-containing protein [Nitrospirae bacterium]|nr:Rieske 2Fe-2S domain-containing protein [Nitrospirota bacterium]
MNTWVCVGSVDDIPRGEGRKVALGDLVVAVFHLDDGRFLAVDHHCPHRRGPLADGLLCGKTVVCPLHGWKVDLDSGNVHGEGAALRTFPAEVREGRIYLSTREVLLTR